MRQFLGPDFLLDTDTAKKLYRNYAVQMPIFDYHSHLSPRQIAQHRRFFNLTELWLETDHYKWRAMRANGVEEQYITGGASHYDKFTAWAAVVPKLAGSPLYHWIHLELQRYFGIDLPLSPRTAAGIWEQTREKMSDGSYTPATLLAAMNVQAVCTTDDPIDALEWHQRIRQDHRIPFQVLPSFRPDRYLQGDRAADEALCRRFGTNDIFSALGRALDEFCGKGCLLSDHGFSSFRYGIDPVVTQRMDFLGREYARHGIVMQLHLGPMRDNSPRLKAELGPDAGGDSVGAAILPQTLSAFLGKLEGENILPKTILYNLNPADNRVMSTMAGNFAPKVQYGAAWWFSDHIRGIRAQLDELMETGGLAASVGMLTDSRSFSSFVRHEYFRRILCQKLGELVEQGLYPDDIETLGEMVQDVCFRNAKRFFSEQSH